ncbi:MAG: hypothetical protein B6U94_02940 [Thermofilum sp. ex4484_79]|nr:MAG: hypothetical protein B6U94_02940 [Thermofilum sp. ex4484_79]
MSDSILKVFIDDREKNSGVPEILENMGIPIVVSRLQIGDYVIGRSIGIERKTANDFINSIIDKRLFEQARYMLESFEKCIFIIEGDFDRVLRYRKVKYNQIFGALVSLMDMNVHVMVTKNEKQSALFLYTLYKRQIKEKRNCYLEPTKIRVIKSNVSLPLIQINLISTFPGISREIADKILRHFKTPRRFFKAAPNELRRVEGLGDKRIRRIIEVLDTMYQPEINKALDSRETGQESDGR